MIYSCLKLYELVFNINFTVNFNFTKTQKRDKICKIYAMYTLAPLPPHSLRKLFPCNKQIFF